MEEEDDKVCPLEGFVQQQQQHIRSMFQHHQQQQQRLHQHMAVQETSDSAGEQVAEAIGDYGQKADGLMENVRFHGNFSATSVTTNASVESFQSVLTSSSASSVSSKKTKFHSFLQSSSAATTQQSSSSLGASSADFHQALASPSLKSPHTFSGLVAIPSASSISTNPQLGISPGFEKMFSEMEATNELKLKKSLQLNRKISILSPAHLSIRSEQTKEEKTSCYINAEAIE